MACVSLLLWGDVVDDAVVGVGVEETCMDLEEGGISAARIGLTQRRAFIESLVPLLVFSLTRP